MGTNGQTNKRTNIYSIFWYKLSLWELVFTAVLVAAIFTNMATMPNN